MGLGIGVPGGRQDGGSTLADRELAVRLMAGESDALVDAYEQYAGLVFGVARRVLKDETRAEDITQEVFAFLWQHPERFDPTRGALRSWLGVLAHRRSVDRVRRDSSRARRETQDLRSPSVGREVDDEYITSWLAERVRDALTQLPAEQRDALVLAYYGDHTYRQVAVQLAIPEGTAKSRVRLALRKLGAVLSAELTDQDVPAWT